MPKWKENVEDVWKMVNMQAIWSTNQQQVLCISMKLLYMIKYNAINGFFFFSSFKWFSFERLLMP